MRYASVIVLIVATRICLGRAYAQSVLPSRQFEVASVREALGSAGVQGGCRGVNSISTGEQQPEPPLGQCWIRGGTLGHLIAIAYKINVNSIQSKLAWVRSGDIRYDVQAKAEDETTVKDAELRIMLQNLLAERFQLKYHLTTTNVEGFALTTSKHGPKLKYSQSETTSITGFYGKRSAPGEPISITARKYSVAMLAELLTRLTGRPVVDKTEITGDYDFMLSWDADENPASRLAPALRDQLGLNIESTRVPSSTFTVDSAEKPSSN